MGKLVDTALRGLKPTGKVQKHADGQGLYLYVSTTGIKSWRYDYTYGGKRKTLTLGKYPEISLAIARKKHLEARGQLEQGIDPCGEKQTIKRELKEEIVHSFENIVAVWFETKQGERTAKHKQDVLSKLKRFILPTFQGRNINSITSREVLECVRKIEAKGIYETAKKVLGICNQVFSFAVGEGLAEINVCAGLSKQLKSVKVKHFAFITDKKVLAELLQGIDKYPHGILIRTALQIAPYVFVRPSELMQAEWEEFNLKEALWTIPPERMKLRKTHLVPLSTQVQDLLHHLHDITGEGKFLFHNWNTNKPITIDGLRQGLRRLGYGADEITPHGFRHTASTLLNELGYNRDYIEKQLAHATGGTVRGTYNHAEYLSERRKMLQEWADFLDGLKKSS